MDAGALALSVVILAPLARFILAPSASTLTSLKSPDKITSAPAGISTFVNPSPVRPDSSSCPPDSIDTLPILVLPWATSRTLPPSGISITTVSPLKLYMITLLGPPPLTIVLPLTVTSLR